ncbi:class I SAM-dependent methyltransferase [Kineococcus arenarius]|uniref:class I SAM-dependent methyltransferase n=1 Tax=unclassified Kineococcus TaxID=2621656 RepID=UPI003D7E6CEF
MSDEEFRDPRLARLYDALDSDRSDLDAYLALAEELHARRVLDVGCGTGTFGLLLAQRGYEVIGVDPAVASVQVHDRDLVTMTANTAQLIVDPAAWAATLSACREALVPGGHLVLETRRPSARAWEGWTAQRTRRTRHVQGVGVVSSHVQTLRVQGALVTFRWSYVLPDEGEGVVTLASTSTLRFRDQAEVEDDVRRAGLVVVDVRDAPDRPGQELVVIARNGPAQDTAHLAA